MVKRLIYIFLAVGLLCSLVACQEKDSSKPKFPLEEDAINAALEQSGLPGVIDESETHSNIKGHTAYALRHPTQTYFNGQNHVTTALIDSALTEGERFLSVTFPSAPVKPEDLSFAWEDRKTQIVFATLLYGSFEDEEEFYRAFSEQEIPEDKETFKWDAQLPSGYCSVGYRVLDSEFESGSRGKRILKQHYMMELSIYESESLYQKLKKAHG